MQALNERTYRATRARIYIFQAVLDGLEGQHDDDVPEALRRDRVDSLRAQLHDLESELASTVTGLPRTPAWGIQSECAIRGSTRVAR